MDYAKLGFKCGIEVHQQLEGKKLFCNCPTLLRDDTPDIIVKRKLRAVAGETGEIDVAARMEMEKEKEFIYEAYSDTTCLIELDEEPPMNINKDALEAALQVALILKANVVDEVEVMRKTIINGSVVSGFQRTSMVSSGGYLETSEGKVGIKGIFLEEDAAKDIRQEQGASVFRLDRLGIPLLEIATDPDIKSGQQCKETAEKIGMILRSTGKAKRGIGTIRQDINISIKDGARIEIKGAQDLKMIPTLVENEVKRQIALVEIKNSLKKFENPEIKKINLQNCQSKIIKSSLDKGGVILGIKAAGFAGLLGKEIQPNKRLGTELSDRAKVAAGVKGLFHSDEDLSKYGMAADEIAKIKKDLDVKPGDGFIIIAEEESKAKKALNAVVVRLKECFNGVPKEVRKPNEDGTTSFMRPIPGAARMYPETDVQSIKTDLKNIKIPELISEKSERVKEYGLANDLADLLAKSGKTEVVEGFISKYHNLKPAFIAETYLKIAKESGKKHNIEIKASDFDFEKVFEALNKGFIVKECLLELFAELGKTQKLNLERYKALSDKEIENEIKKIAGESKQNVSGRAIAKLRGRADVQKIISISRKFE